MDCFLAKKNMSTYNKGGLFVNMKKVVNLFIFSVFILFLSGSAQGQELEDYLLGEEQQLQIVVYILGAVAKPGEYRVSDHMDVVELISKASGTTDFSNMGKVSITRHKSTYLAGSGENSGMQKTEGDKEIIYFDVNNYLKKIDGPPPPKVMAGDVIFVPTNKWKTWRTVAAILWSSIVAMKDTFYI